jgi:hypothetical protein
MQECRVCELLFLGGGSCPSCGSQVATDISVEDISMDDDSIPGLDDVAEAIGSDEEHESEDGQILPFGMGAKAEVLESSLPFGVGSVGGVVHEISIPDSDEELEVLDSAMDEVELEVQPEVEANIDLSSDIDFTAPVPSVENEASVVNLLDGEPELVDTNLESTLVEDSAENFIMESVDITGELEVVQPIEEVTTSSEPIAFEESLDTLVEEAPEMWRIDAAVVDMDEIYAQDEQIIEVNFDDDLDSTNVEVNFDDFHHSAVEDSIASSEESPELHPARALPVDASGQPEIAEMVQNAFTHMSNSSWVEAAQILSTASANRQNDSAILNNLGLALLQSALEMDGGGDSMATSQYEAAIMALRQGAKIDAVNDTILLNLAHALLVSGRAEKALGVVTVLRQRSESNIEVDNTLGACLIQLERKDEAKIILTPYSEDAIVSANLALV